MSTVFPALPSFSSGTVGRGEGPSVQVAPPPPPAPSPEPSVVAMEDDDVLKIWPRLIAMLKPHGSALAAGLSLASLESLSDGLAVIRFKSEGETFARAWASNGKREIIGRTLSQLRGQPVELKFEITPAAPASATTITLASPNGESDVETAADAPPSPPPPPPRVSVEIPAEVRGDPLVQAVLKEFGGEIVRCE